MVMTKYFITAYGDSNMFTGSCVFLLNKTHSESAKMFFVMQNNWTTGHGLLNWTKGLKLFCLLTFYLTTH